VKVDVPQPTLFTAPKLVVKLKLGSVRVMESPIAKATGVVNANLTEALAPAKGPPSTSPRTRLVPVRVGTVIAVLDAIAVAGTLTAFAVTVATVRAASLAFLAVAGFVIPEETVQVHVREASS
jgi:hypothetical protein